MKPSGTRVPAEILKKLSRIRPWRSLAQLVFEWTAILGAAAFCESHWSWGLYLATVVWVGSRQHALGVLMHDAAHYRLSRNRAVNDWMAELFIAWPFFFSMRSFRRNHSLHHEHTNTAQDPDWSRKQIDPTSWSFPRARSSILGLLLKDLCGANILMTLRDIRYTAKATRHRNREGSRAALANGIGHGIYLAVLFGAITWLHLWRPWALYFLVPGLTYLRMVLHLRTIADHVGLSPTHELDESRTILTHPLERLLLAPNNIAYHIEHHLYPSVPFYSLPALHRELMKNEAYRRRAHLTRGFTGLIRELEIKKTTRVKKAS